jgi:hypothetical protein
MEKTCVCCKRKFTANPAVHNQQYCGNADCQKARKRKWQREKLAKDSAYRENQDAAQREWCSRNKDYWKEYRKRNPAYAERNRIGQRERNRWMRSKLGIAKMDELRGKNLIPPGRYRLVPLSNQLIAKMDELIVEIGVISRGCDIGVQGS